MMMDAEQKRIAQQIENARAFCHAMHQPEPVIIHMLAPFGLIAGAALMAGVIYAAHRICG